MSDRQEDGLKTVRDLLESDPRYTREDALYALNDILYGQRGAAETPAGRELFGEPPEKTGARLVSEQRTRPVAWFREPTGRETYRVVAWGDHPPPESEDVVWRPLYEGAPPEKTESVRALVLQQAEDAGLWFAAETAPEAYLQRALRQLHAAVEGETIAFKDPPPGREG